MTDDRHPTGGEPSRVSLGGHALRCEASGRGDPPWVCLHGLVDTLAIWDRVAEALSGDRRLVRLDQRAHGGSDSPPGPYTREALAADVIGVLDALAIERAVLVGHSMGGIVAMATALARPERVAGLVLIGTAPQCSARVSEWYERIACAGETDGLPGLARIIYGERTRRRIEGDPQGIAHMTRALKSLHSDPLTPKLAELTCPVLLLVGEKDPMGPRASEIIREALPPGGSRLEVVPGAGHWLHVETPEVVIRTVKGWCEEVGL